MNAEVFWCTGMSGVGKSTLSEYAKDNLERSGHKVLVLDGDVIRSKYTIPLGFSRNEVKSNNMNMLSICVNERANYDVIIVPIISPIRTVREKIRSQLSPGFHLLYITAGMEILKRRDPKGLYNKAEKGEITDLIGYADSNPYEIPDDFDLKVDTSSCIINESQEIFMNYILSNL